MAETPPPMSRRFRGFLPVVVDVETGGFDHKRDALLEIAAVLLCLDDDGRMSVGEDYSAHVEPFEGANMDPKSLEITGIDPWHPFRMAKKEDVVVREMFRFVSRDVKAQGCNRAIMVGHNTVMDLNFVNAAATRNKISRNPFHPFSMFDTVSFAGLAYGQTVLSRAAQSAGMEWDTEAAHSALYDARMTAEIFCRVVNRWVDTAGPVWT